MSNSLLRLVVSFATVDKLTGPLKGIVGLAQSGGERLAGMKREARDLERELKAVKAEQLGATGNVTALMDRERDLAARIASTNRQMEEQVRLLRIQAKVGAMEAKGEALKSAGQGNIFAGAATLAPFVLVGKGIADFQAGMTDIALKADLSQRETARLQGNILAAARAAKQLPESMRAGADVLAGFGMSPAEATRMIAPIGKVATAYRAEIADLAAASFANFSNLKVPIAQNAKALEAMAAAGNAGAFEIKDMAQYFPALTAQAQAFGQKGVAAVADLAAAAQIARKGTGDSASAATNLQNLLAKINMKDTIKNFAAFGVDLPKAMKKAYREGKTPLEAIAEITNKALKGKLDKVSFLFGDMQAQQAIRPLIQNMEEYRRIRAAAMASTGAIDAAFARRSQDASTQVQALVGNLQRLALTLGPVVLPPLIRLTERAIMVTDRVVAWAQANPRLAGTLVALVAGFGALRIGLGLVQFAFGGLLGPMAGVFGFLMRNGPAVASAFGMIRMAALFLGRGILQAGAMMLANPVVLIILGIAAANGGAAWLIYCHWDTIKAAFWGGVSGAQRAIAWLRAEMSAGLAWFAALPSRFLAFGSAMLQGLVDGIAAKIAAVRSMVLGIAGNVATWFKGVLGIRSPSRVFMGLGGHIASGLALGILGGQGAAVAAAEGMAGRVAAVSFAAPGQTVAGPSSSPFMPALEPLGARAPRAGRGGGSSAAAPISFGNVEIKIVAVPGQSARDIAEAVRDALAQHAAAARAAARSDYRDDEDA